MKSGKSIIELAQQIQDIKDNSRDFIVPTAKLSMTIETDREEVVRQAGLPPEQKSNKIFKPVLEFKNGDDERFALNSHSSRQLATYTGIPQAYYDKIQDENPNLLASNVNHGLRMQSQQEKRGKIESRMLRTYRGSLRGFVSSSYRRLDCFDLLETVFPIINDNGFEVISTELTEQRMYLQVHTPRISAEVKKGDVVQYGMTISSSDVGAGSVRVEPLIVRLICLNGATFTSSIKKMHVGRNQAGDDIQELLSENTKNLSDAAFWSEVRDVVIGTMQQDFFKKQVEKLQFAATDEIKNFNIPEVVELASKHLGITNNNVRNSVVSYLANGADGAGLTRWGLSNAFTFAANQDFVSYDDSVELQRSGSRILDLTSNQWRQISAE